MLGVEAMAERELARVPDWLWDGASPPVPVEAIADSHYGLIVGESDDLGSMVDGPAGGWISGLLLPDRREIWVNSDEAARAPGRRRFTIGHWTLHCRLGAAGSSGAVHCRDGEVREEAAAVGAAADPVALDPARYPPDELEANQFAAALLMPGDLLTRERERLRGDERALSERFGVSRLALQRRLWFLAGSGS